MAQNIPDLLTVSLEEECGMNQTADSCPYLCVVDGYLPAVDHNGFVDSPTLYLVHLLHHSNDGLWVGALALRVPVKYLKLNHLL